MKRVYTVLGAAAFSVALGAPVAAEVLRMSIAPMTFVCRDFRTMDKISRHTTARDLTIEMADIGVDAHCSRSGTGGSFEIRRAYVDPTRRHPFVALADHNDTHFFVFLEEGL